MTAVALPDGSYLVMGSWATKPEYFVALALEKMDIPYDFQYRLFGGRTVRGGVVVDFVAYRPFGLPLEVYGDHWHSGQLGADDRLRNARIAEYFRVPEVLIVWGRQAETAEETYQTVRRLLA